MSLMITRILLCSIFGLVLSSLSVQPLTVAAAVRNATPTTTILYSFTGNSDCGEPFATLTPGPNGVFYGF
ncbi:MAG: hypothetical protein IAI50_08375, partial [Candidatus Eremiobacteraeota bacterium]|nr:hypothetical protein [Candidatus Eremiobacteraeota bacterium]